MSEHFPENGVVIVECNDDDCTKAHHHVKPLTEEEVEDLWEDET